MIAQHPHPLLGDQLPDERLSAAGLPTTLGGESFQYLVLSPGFRLAFWTGSLILGAARSHSSDSPDPPAEPGPLCSLPLSGTPIDVSILEAQCVRTSVFFSPSLKLRLSVQGNQS